MRNILITGSHGMVGRNLIEVLSKKKNYLLLPDRKELDLLNKQKIRNYIKNKKPNIIIHCASLVGGILFNKQNQYKLLQENIELNLNLINAAYEAGIKKLINFSSSCVYPNNNNIHKEKNVFDGNFEKTNEGYAISKYVSMKLCEYINRQKNFNYKTIIPCNLYGKWDLFDKKKSHLISSAILKIHNAKINNLKVIKIWGTGKPKREFLYCSDLTNFVKFAIKNYSKIPEFINVGFNKDYSVEYYYNTICKIINYFPKFEFDHSKPDGVYQKKMNISELKKIGGFRQTSLKKGIEQTYRFYLEHYEN